MWSQAPEREILYVARKMLMCGNHWVFLCATCSDWYTGDTVHVLSAQDLAGSNPHADNWYKHPNKNMQFFGQVFPWGLPGVLHKGPAHSSSCLHQTFKIQGPGLAFAPVELPFRSATALTFRTCYREYTDVKMKDLIFTPHKLGNCCYSWEELHASMRSLNKHVWNNLPVSQSQERYCHAMATSGTAASGLLLG